MTSPARVRVAELPAPCIAPASVQTARKHSTSSRGVVARGGNLLIDGHESRRALGKRVGQSLNAGAPCRRAGIVIDSATITRLV